jgi:hypothetical protein
MSNPSSTLIALLSAVISLGHLSSSVNLLIKHLPPYAKHRGKPFISLDLDQTFATIRQTSWQAVHLT